MPEILVVHLGRGICDEWAVKRGGRIEEAATVTAMRLARAYDAGDNDPAVGTLFVGSRVDMLRRHDAGEEAVHPLFRIADGHRGEGDDQARELVEERLELLMAYGRFKETAER